MLSSQERQTARTIVLQHSVFFEVVWALEVVEEEPRCVGYDVQILGTNERGLRRALTNQRECVHVWHDLRRLAQTVLPTHPRGAARLELGHYDCSLVSEGSSARADVCLVIMIRHAGSDYFAPVDAQEKTLVEEIVAELESLGAHPGAPPLSGFGSAGRLSRMG